MRWRERSRVCYDLYFSKRDLMRIPGKHQNKHAGNTEEDDYGEEGESEDDEVGDYDSNAESEDAQNDTSKEFSFQDNQKPSFPPTCHRSRARFFFPRKYSYRMQHIISQQGEEQVHALCFPPLAPKYDNNLVDPDEPKDKEHNSSNNANHSSSAENEAKASSVHRAHVQDNSKPWTCIYKRISI